MSATPLTKAFVRVLGHRIAYHYRGEGQPILFLHGNPTSSYLWRNVLPEMEGVGRLIAPDLIGMGDSEKLPDPNASTYRYRTHRAHIWAFIDAVIGPEAVILVGHDWGSALCFDWAMHHPDRVAGIAYMEGVVRQYFGWQEFRPDAVETFKKFRSDAGEEMVLNQNMFVENVLPGLVLRPLSQEEMSEYRRPFSAAKDRWPTLTWPREIPVGGEPADVAAIVDAYADWLSSSHVPKLFINGEPGAIVTGARREFCRTWPNQSEVTVRGAHFLQEDSGPEIGRALADWSRKLFSGSLPS
jgi:haloalkane dehalogenase